MSLLLAPIVEVYRLILQPVAPFTWFGLQLSTLDVAAAFRLCVALRQIREKLWSDHVLKQKTVRADEKGTATATISEIEPRSFVRDAAAALVVVYGGEAVMGELYPSVGLGGYGRLSGGRVCSPGVGDPAFLHVLRGCPGILYGRPGDGGQASIGADTVVPA